MSTFSVKIRPRGSEARLDFYMNNAKCIIPYLLNINTLHTHLPQNFTTKCYSATVLQLEIGLPHTLKTDLYYIYIYIYINIEVSFTPTR